MSKSPRVITDSSELKSLAHDWSAEAVVGIDTEAASFHRYHDRVYLMQLSSARETILVDPLAVASLEPLRSWFSSSETEFVFHDADYDLRLLHRDAGLRIHRLFDTRVAAQFLNLASIGLGALLEQRFGIQTDKRFQRADWSSRPLSPEMLDYAATDTRHLPELRDQFLKELRQIGRLAWVEEECQLLTAVEWPTPPSLREAALHVKGARTLDRRSLAILIELFEWRQRTAERLDRALFRVLATEAMIEIAKLRPTTPEKLRQIRGISADLLAKRGREILEAIERGLAVPDRLLPAFEKRPRYRSDPSYDERLAALKAWRAELVEKIQLPPGLLAPNALLETVARSVPTSLDALEELSTLRRWQIEVYGEDLLRALKPKVATSRGTP